LHASSVSHFIAPEQADMDSEANPRYIAFNDVEIDLVGRRVRVAGIDTALEPKAFEVLVLLAQEPGKAFARDDILDAVWGHRHVTPGVLNRAVTLIRQVLGDSAHTLRTLHGIGYRFDGEARFFSRREEINTVAPVAGDTQDAVTSAQSVLVSSSAPAVSEVAPTAPIDPQPDPQPTAAALAAPTAIRPAWRRWRFLPFAVALAAAATGLLLWHAWDREPTAKAPSSSPTLVVLPLHAIGGDKNETAFADGLSEELTTQLAHIEGLRLISSTSAVRAQKDGFDTAQLAERLHVTHALEGSLREVGDQLRIDVRLIETPSGRTLWAQDFDRKSGEIFAIQQEITQAVAAVLALRIRLAHSSVETSDPQAYREYLRLRHVFSTANTEATEAQAENDLRTLIARAPSFAAAHGLLALILNLTPKSKGEEDDALREIHRTLTLDSDNADAHAALAKIEFRAYNWAAGEKEINAARAAQPSDVILNLIAGMWLSRLGYGERALAYFRAAYATDPLGYWANNDLGSELDALGRHDEAKLYLDALPDLELSPEEDNSLTLPARWNNAVWRHDYSAAREFAAQMPEKDGLKKAYVKVTAALTDSPRWSDAEAAVAERESKIGGPPLIELFMPNFKAAALLAQLERSNQQHGGLVWTVENAALRRDPAFQDFIQRMKFIDYWRTNGWPPQCKPDGDGARCT
jgi:TolB-like protein/DNA-binding winged helix-turn-helix (wHTH) protein/Tfp pilus assembly protein PilF